MGEILAEFVSEFKGAYPDVPFAPGVDAEGIKADDSDPVFITLPLVKVGGKSNNGFTWTGPDVQRVVEEINSKRPEGNLGHIRPENRSSQYDLPKLRWVGAILVDGTAYGKAYVPKYANEVREYFRNAKRMNARVGTSVYGLRGKIGLADMTLESIDLGHPDRLGSPEAAAIPQITSEFEEQNKHTEEHDVDANETLIAELRTDRDNERKTVSELQNSLRDKDKLVAEGQQAKTDLAALVSELNLGENPVQAAKALISELATLRKDKLERDINDVIVAEVKNEAVRPYISRLMTAKSADEAKAQVSELLKDPMIVELSKKLISEARGGGAYVGGDADKGELKDTPESRAEARRKTGI